MAKTYIFSVKHPGAFVGVAEAVTLEGPYDLPAAKKAIRAKFPDAREWTFQGVEAPKQEGSTRWDRPEDMGGGVY